jgi:predicted nucleic acid-binding protein
MGTLMALERVYLDTNVIIAITENQSEIGEGQKRLIKSFLNKETNGMTSEITLAECLVRPVRELNQALIELYLELLTAGSDLFIAGIDTNVLIEAANVRARHKIKLPDAIHIATAQLSNCTTFVTNDHRLANLWGKNAIIWETL